MSAGRILPIILAALVANAGCVFCPWLAREGDVAECQGLVIDGLQDQPYRLRRSGAGPDLSRSIELRIDGSCTIERQGNMAALGVEEMRIEHPRSARDAVMIIRAARPDAPSETVACSAPLAESGPMRFVCPPEAKGLQFVLTPIR